MLILLCLLPQAKAHQGSYLSRLQYRCNSRFAKASIGQKNGAGACPPPFAFANGTAAFYFNSTTIYDDLLWAAGWMYRATGVQTEQMTSPRRLQTTCCVFCMS